MDKARIVETIRRKVAAENERCAKQLEGLAGERRQIGDFHEAAVLRRAAMTLRRTCPKE